MSSVLIPRDLYYDVPPQYGSPSLIHQDLLQKQLGGSEERFTSAEFITAAIHKSGTTPGKVYRKIHAISWCLDIVVLCTRKLRDCTANAYH